MPCIEHPRSGPHRAWRSPWFAVLICILFGAVGCAQLPGAAPPTRPATTAPVAMPAAPAATNLPSAAAPRPAAATATPSTGAASPVQATPAPGAGVVPKPRVPRYVKLAPPSTPRSAAELRLQFARRLVEAHPDSTYTRRPPERLLAIPVLEVELNADGSVRQINVLRRPSTGNEATALAIDAVHRAAPYGNVSGLPRPWKVVETFLFDDELRFKPRTLDTN